jgi:hypothetical protein
LNIDVFTPPNGVPGFSPGESMMLKKPSPHPFRLAILSIPSTRVTEPKSKRIGTNKNSFVLKFQIVIENLINL